MYKSTIFLLIIAGAICMFTGCSNKNEEEKVVSFDLSGLDTTVSPQEDFYHYAVGNWLKNNPIPEDQTRWASFTILAEETKSQLKTIIDDVSAKPGDDKSSMRYKVGTFYNTAMDSVKIDKDGWQPLAPELKRIDAISDKEGLIKEVAHMHVNTSSPLFYFGSAVDEKNSDSVIANIWQGGLGLPDRDYYFNSDDKSKETREKYVEHIAKMLQLMGIDEEASKTEAQKIMEFETKLAESSNTRVENRNPQATYNKLTTEEIAEKAPGFNWNMYLTEIGAGDPGVIDIGQPKFIIQVGKLVDSEPLDTWKSYLKWNLVNAMAPYLSSDFANTDFDFYDKYLRGAEKQQPRWKRAIGYTNGALGEAVGQLYVKEYFPPEAKEKAQAIVKNIVASMKERIENLDWMSNETKKQALTKLAGFGVKIGYPDKWRDYSELEVTPDSFVQNIINSNAFDHKEMLSEINQPVKPWQWEMTPQTVNAYYSPSRNEIVFPAAILQFPFYDYRVDDAINYGGMGAVIGHEITHGFDDQGRQYDANGNLRDWWTEEDAKRFDERAQVVVDQFNNYIPVDTLKVNGKLTLGENIADFGGLTISYNAFKKTEQFKNGEMIDGFTPAQRFFLSWAQVWKTNIREEALVQQIKTDPHSPAMYRVIGPLSNMPEFFEAFNIKDGDKMRRKDLAKIW